MNVGAVFGIITAILVIVFVILLGSGQISNMFSLGGIAQVNKAVLNFEEVVDDLYSAAQGSSDRYKFRIPETAKVCFIDPEHPEPNLDSGWRPDPTRYNIIKNTIQLNNYNIWIEYGVNSGDNPGKRNSKIYVGENFCAGPSDYVYLENTGTEVSVQLA